MSVWHQMQTGFRVAALLLGLVAAFGAFVWVQGGDPEYGTAAAKLLLVLGIVGAGICAVLGHRGSGVRRAGRPNDR
jgi:hypothetical protein